jgi:hypothetical protein
LGERYPASIVDYRPVLSLRTSEQSLKVDRERSLDTNAVNSCMNSGAREDFDELIDKLLAGRMPFAEFQRAYSDRFIDENACSEFRVEEVDHYGAVHEKAEWTTPSPTDEDRSYGWIDPAEFKAWLEIHDSHKPPDSRCDPGC